MVNFCCCSGTTVKLYLTNVVVPTEHAQASFAPSGRVNPIHSCSVPHTCYNGVMTSEKSAPDTVPSVQNKEHLLDELLNPTSPLMLARELELTVKKEFPKVWPVVRAQVHLARNLALGLVGEIDDKLAREMRLCLESVQKVLAQEQKRLAETGNKEGIEDL